MRRRLGDRADGAGDRETGADAIGGFHGTGAAVYVLTCAGQLLGAPELLEDAVRAARGITPERVARDRNLDVVAGSAGAILVLLALDRALEDLGETTALAEIRSRADACARRLLSCRLEPQGGGPRGWGVGRVPSGRLQSGFAHGAAGIAWALVRLYRRTKERELLEAALEGMAFERRLYRADLGRWLPFSAPSEKGLHLMSAWCRGGPGIALGRIACLEALGAEPSADLEAVGRDCRDGLRATLEQPQTLEDHLCCGNLGRAEVLVRSFAASAARSIADRPPELLAAADRLVYGVLGKARARGTFGWSTEAAGDPSPSFMKGAAGVGFAFLRLARPDVLPFPLLLEPVPGRHDSDRRST